MSGKRSPVYHEEPSQYGLLAWTGSPKRQWNDQVAAKGYRVVHKIRVPVSITATNLLCEVRVAGDTLTSGECWAGLYGSDGVLLRKTASQHTAWQSTGNKSMALSTPVAIVGGPNVFVWAAFVINGTTAPAFATQIGIANNPNLSAANSDCAYIGAGADTDLTNFTPSGLSAYTLLAWFGIS
jgi:hypothetical protein